MKIQQLIKKGISIVACCSLILTMAACGSTDVPVSVSEVPEVSVSAPEPVPVTELVKESYDDFYMQVNEGWLSDNPLGKSSISWSRSDECSDVVGEQLRAMFDSYVISEHDADDPMNKLMLYYEQLKDSDQRNNLSMSRLKELTDHVQNIKNLKAFTDMMSDEEYSLFNDFCQVSYELNTGGDNAPCFRPVPLLDIYNQLSDEECAILTEGYTNALISLGYSEDVAGRIAANAVRVNNGIIFFYNNINGNISGYNETRWERTECSVDLMTIVRDLDYVISDDWGTYPTLFIYDGYLEWLNALITPDNLELIKDFYTVSVVSALSGCGSSELINALDEMLLKLGGAEMFDDDEDLKEPYALSQVINVDEGALSAYYASMYITDEQKEMVNELTSHIIDSYVEIIKNIDWLDMVQRERINVKLKKTRFYIGCIEEYNHLEDVEIKENVIDTTIDILKSNRKFNQGCLVEGKRLVPGTFDMFRPNAVYYGSENAVVITNGYFAIDSLWNDASFEERLGTLGRVIAHELGHEFDSRNIGLKNNGVYDERWNDFWEPYYNSFTPVLSYYDGMETLDGNVINGNIVCNESYADLVALKIIMGILNNTENSDYDAFFKAYAMDQATVIRPEYERFLLAHDTHATPRERVNGCLAQTDEFYNTYDISTDSSFYVKPEDRIKILETVN